MAPRGRPKNYAACLTCKIRRVKCDEARPACRRCTLTGRKCDGYASPSSSAVTVKLFSTGQELRSFQYFCEKTSLEITGHYDEAFWQSLVLQLSHLNRGMGHLVVAIGSLHELMKSPAWPLWKSLESSSSMAFSLQQCNKAVALFKQDASDKASMGVLVASCVLLMAFELLQDRVDTAMKHFLIGKRMLQAWSKSSPTDTSQPERKLVDNHLTLILDRFGESSGADIPKDVVLPLKRHSIDDLLAETPEYGMPAMFSSLGQARFVLDTTLYSLFGCIKEASLKPPIERLQCSCQLRLMLKAWCDKFEDLVPRLGTYMSESDRRRTCLLKVQYIIGDIELDGCIADDEMTYDKYHDLFGQIVSLCRKVVEIESGQKVSKSTPPKAFSFDSGIISALSWAVWKCRDPVIRREALALLKHCLRREGLWLSRVNAMVGEQIIDIEEEGLEVTYATDIPPTHRMRLDYMRYDPCPVGKQGKHTLYRPALEIVARLLDENSNRTSRVARRSVRFPLTLDESPGLRPYPVFMLKRLEMQHWKLFLGKRIFEEPRNDYTSEFSNMRFIVQARLCLEQVAGRLESGMLDRIDLWCAFEASLLQVHGFATALLCLYRGSVPYLWGKVLVPATREAYMRFSCDPVNGGGWEANPRYNTKQQRCSLPADEALVHLRPESWRSLKRLFSRLANK